MADDSDPTTPVPNKPPFRDSGSAPFIYFDGASCHGVLAGAIQVEIVANVLIPMPDGSVRLETVPTAHLRCSPAAAASLRNSLNAVLKMIENLQGGTSVAANKLN